MTSFGRQKWLRTDGCRWRGDTHKVLLSCGFIAVLLILIVAWEESLPKPPRSHRVSSWRHEFHSPCVSYRWSTNRNTRHCNDIRPSLKRRYLRVRRAVWKPDVDLTKMKRMTRFEQFLSYFPHILGRCVFFSSTVAEKRSTWYMYMPWYKFHFIKWTLLDEILRWFMSKSLWLQDPKTNVLKFESLSFKINFFFVTCFYFVFVKSWRTC